VSAGAARGGRGTRAPSGTRAEPDGKREARAASGTRAESNRIDRVGVKRLLGDPVDQVGSVNDPRTRETAGVRWNEKWVYRAEHGAAMERVVLWNRYDFLGVFRVHPDGTLEPEPLPAG
jgi:hypothetical protein